MSGDALRPIDALTALMECGPFPALRAQLIDRFGDVVHLFEVKGWLTRAPTPTHTACVLCNRGHEAELNFDPHAKVGRYCCVEAGGWGEVAISELESLVLNLDFVLKDIRAALHPISFPIEKRLPGLLWRLGESSSGGGPWTAMFARDVYNDRLARCLAYLPSVSTVPGLVLTSSGTVAELGKIAGFRFTGLGAVLNLDVDGKFSVDGGALGAALGRQTKTRSGRGRPPNHEVEALAVVDGLLPVELALEDEALFAKVIARVPELRSKGPERIAETLRRAIVNRIRDRRAEVKRDWDLG